MVVGMTLANRVNERMLIELQLDEEFAFCHT